MVAGGMGGAMWELYVSRVSGASLAAPILGRVMSAAWASAILAQAGRAGAPGEAGRLWWRHPRSTFSAHSLSTVRYALDFMPPDLVHTALVYGLQVRRHVVQRVAHGAQE